MTKSIGMIFAATRDLGIGLKNQLPWPKLNKDMSFFKKITSEVRDKTKKNAVIMGFNTFSSMNNIGLPGRENIVITRKPKSILEQFEKPGIRFCGNLEDSYKTIEDLEDIEKSLIIGGATIYEQAITLSSKYPIDKLYETRIFKDFETDVKINKDLYQGFTKNFPYKKASQTIVEQNDVNYDFLIYSAEKMREKLPFKISQEYQYLELLKEIIEKGDERPDRTDTGTLSLFGKSMRFDLEAGFPLLTTKTTFYRGIFEELLWFLRGDTDGMALLDKNIKIWEGNGSRDFLDKRGLPNRREHDLGPVYGFQWRHFGADYKTCSDDYSGKGVDQIKDLISDLKTNKYSRRHIVSAWNPTDLNQMALPPCHVMFQFYIDSKDRLSCSLYQRSADIGLGVPFNIASYALLLCMIADHLSLRRGEFVHFIGDTHIYLNHIDALKKQMKKTPNPFPILLINKKNKRENIWDYQIEDFELINYHGLGKLKMKMAV